MKTDKSRALKNYVDALNSAVWWRNQFNGADAGLGNKKLQREAMRGSALNAMALRKYLLS